VSQLTPSTHVPSPPAEPLPRAVPLQVPVNGATGPVGAIAPEGGVAAVTYRMGNVANATAMISTLKIKLKKSQRSFN